MTLVEMLLLLIVAGICGAIGQAIVGRSRGMIVSVAVGFVGALLGTWLARLLHLPKLLDVSIGGHHIPIVWTILGAALFVAVVALVGTPRARPIGSV